MQNLIRLCPSVCICFLCPEDRVACNKICFRKSYIEQQIALHFGDLEKEIYIKLIQADVEKVLSHKALFPRIPFSMMLILFRAHTGILFPF